MRAEQQTVTRAFAKPLFFADVAWQYKSGVPTKRRESRFVFREYRGSHRGREIPFLFLLIHRQLLARHAQLNSRHSESTLDLPFENFLYFPARSAGGFER